jgi:uncharacterized protein with von Willebrand factor type A (vWA) domain
MLIDFFLKLKSHKLPVSIKEYLTLLEAMGKNVIGRSVDDFYYVSRTALVKDEANYDKFDRAFAEFWQGVETIPGIEAEIALASPGTPHDYAKFLAAEQAKWGPIVTAIGFKEQN